MVWVTYEIFRKYIVTKRKKESGMEPVTVTIVGTEVYYGASDNPREVHYGLNLSVSDVMYYGVDYNPREVHYGLNLSVSDVMNYGVDNPEVFATLEEFDIPDIDVTDVPPNVVYPEMILKFHFYVMSSIM